MTLPASARAADQDLAAGPVHELPSRGYVFSASPQADGWVVAWSHPDRWTLESTRIEADGSALPPVLIASTGMFPAVSCNDSDCLYAWVTATGAIHVERRDGYGNPIGEGVDALMPPHWAIVAAIGRTAAGILLVWIDDACCMEDTPLYGLDAIELGEDLRPAGPQWRLTAGHYDGVGFGNVTIGDDPFGVGWLVAFNEFDRANEGPQVLRPDGGQTAFVAHPGAEGGAAASVPGEIVSIDSNGMTFRSPEGVAAQIPGSYGAMEADSYDGEEIVVVGGDGRGSVDAFFATPSGRMITPLPVAVVSSAAGVTLASNASGRTLLIWNHWASRGMRYRMLDHGDGIPDDVDDCPGVYNPDQSDADHDGIGDACEDLDGDGVQMPEDDCPYAANPDQTDLDHDGIGDACDPDLDNDGVPNEHDNCPRVANPDQVDADHDGVGDACDAIIDSDGDGVADSVDDCPGSADPEQPGDCSDADGDGVPARLDNCPTVSNPDQLDHDFDQIGDACDPDADGDRVANRLDNCPMIRNPDQLDSDHDGVGDACDPFTDLPQRPRGCDIGDGAAGTSIAPILLILPWIVRRRRRAPR